jgi:hypothetical protein
MPVEVCRPLISAVANPYAQDPRNPLRGISKAVPAYHAVRRQGAKPACRRLDHTFNT